MNSHCPYCGSTESQGVSSIHASLGDVNWDAEQLVACLNPECQKEYVIIYLANEVNIKLEESTVFSE